MNKIIIFIILAVFISCTNKTQKNGGSEVLAKINEETNFEIKLPVFMYVNSKEGLRLRDKPDISGKVLDILKYKQQVIIEDKSNDKVVIDSIDDYWYLVTVDNRIGWVFAGYLRNTIDEIDCEEIAGLYYAHDIEVIEESLTYFYGIDSLINFNNFKNEMFFEIIYIGENQLKIDYHFPFYGSANPKHNNRKFQYAIEEDAPFLYFEEGSGAGNTDIYMYYREEQILMKFMREASIYERFICEIIFKKSSTEIVPNL